MPNISLIGKNDLQIYSKIAKNTNLFKKSPHIFTYFNHINSHACKMHKTVTLCNRLHSKQSFLLSKAPVSVTPKIIIHFSCNALFGLSSTVSRA